MQTLKVVPTPVVTVWWLQPPYRGPTFNDPESFFIFGNPHTGKSNQAMAVAENYIAHGHQVIDPFGAENDSDVMVWYRSPYKDRTIMIHGGDVQVESAFPKISVDAFTLDAVKDYDVVVTDRALYGSDYSHYAALARIFELCKKRKGWKQDGKGRIIAILVREAWNVIYSQIRAGASKDEQDAQREFIKLNNQRAHAGLAPIIDTQRYMDLSTSVRQLANYRVIKGFGGQVIPDEFDFLFKPSLFGNTPWLLRNLPPDEFLMVTSWNGVARGLVGKVPWAINKGEDLIQELGIVVTPVKIKAEPEGKDVVSEEKVEKAKRVPTINETGMIEVHNAIVKLHNEGKNYVEIAKAMTLAGVPMSWFKARYHVRGECICGGKKS